MLKWVFQQTIDSPEVGEITVENSTRSFGQLWHIIGITIALKKRAVRPEDFFLDEMALVKEELPNDFLSEIVRPRKEKIQNKSRRK